MNFQLTNKIEACDLDCNNTSFHNGLFYCISVRFKPRYCPSESWFSVFCKQTKMRGFGEVAISCGEDFCVLKLSLDGVGFYEAKNATKSIVSAIKITNEKLASNSENNDLKAPCLSEDLSPLFFKSFMEILSNEG